MLYIMLLVKPGCLVEICHQLAADILYLYLFSN